LRAGGRSPYVVVVLSDAEAAFHARAFTALVAELAAVDLRPVVTVIADDPHREEAFVDESQTNNLTGLIIVQAHPESPRTYAGAAANSAIRIVSLDPAVTGDGISVVVGDELNAGRLAAQQLLDHGHRALGVVGDHSTSVITTRRLEGIQSAF